LSICGSRVNGFKGEKKEKEKEKKKALLCLANQIARIGAFE
jgi:hypothetical protein